MTTIPRLQRVHTDGPPEYDDPLPGYEPRDSLGAQFMMNNYTKTSQAFEPTDDSFYQVSYSMKHNPAKFGRPSKTDNGFKLIRTSIWRDPTDPLANSGMPVRYTNDTVATLEFSKAETAPSCPRATITHGDEQISLASENFADWTFTIDKEEYRWKIVSEPPCLEMYQTSSGRLMARFDFHSFEKRKVHTIRIGKLSLIAGIGDEPLRMMELFICSFYAAIGYEGCAGKMLSNQAYYGSAHASNNSLLGIFAMTLGSALAFTPW